jgi:hypothetical protein
VRELQLKFYQCIIFFSFLVSPVVIDALDRALSAETEIGEVVKETDRINKNMEQSLHPLLERITSGTNAKMQEAVKESKFSIRFYLTVY